VRWSDFDGRYRIVYFGYTFCPDACPTDMAVIGHALDQLEKSHPGLTRAWCRSSSPSIPSGHAADRRPVRRRLLAARHRPDRAQGRDRQGRQEFAVYHARRLDAGRLSDRPQPHGLLMGPKGEPIAILPADKGPDAVAAEIVKWVK
jgi:protein SCO1/2